MLALWIVLGTVAYLQLGYQLGKFSWKKWREGKSDGLVPFLLFPISASRSLVGKSVSDNGVEDDCKTAEGCGRVLAFLWPFKIAFNLCAPLFMGLGWFVPKFFKALLQGPEEIPRRLSGWGERRRQRKLESAEERQKQLDAPPQNILALSDEYRSQLERRAETHAHILALSDEYHCQLKRHAEADARITEIESRPDFEQVRAARTRF